MGGVSPPRYPPSVDEVLEALKSSRRSNRDEPPAEGTPPTFLLIENRLKSIESTLASLVEVIRVIKSGVLQTEVSVDLTPVEEAVSSLRSELSSLSSDLASIRSELSDLRDSLSSVSSRIESVLSELSDIRSELESALTRSDNARSEPEQPEPKRRKKESDEGGGSRPVFDDVGAEEVVI